MDGVDATDPARSPQGTGREGGREGAKAAAVFCLAALVVAAVGAVPDPPPDPALSLLGHGLRRAMGLAVEPLFLLSLLGGLAILGSFVGKAACERMRRKKRGVQWVYPERKFENLALACLLLAATVLGLRLLVGTSIAVPVPSPQARAVPAPEPRRGAPPARPAPVQRTPSWPLAALLALAAGAGGMLVLARSRASRNVAEPPPLAESVAAVRRRLELGDHLRNAIVACYADMCRLFNGSGRPRTSHLTAREFAELLRARGIEEPEIRTLTSVFEKARYSVEPCDESDRLRATEALRAIESHHGAGRGRAS